MAMTHTGLVSVIRRVLRLEGAGASTPQLVASANVGRARIHRPELRNEDRRLT